MTTTKDYIPSEKYRQMLVRDGERRFKEWHNNFLNYQQVFVEDMNKRKAK